MPIRTDPSQAPDPSVIRAALDRVTASQPFDTSPKLTSFLRFVVESTLAGRGARLKGYTIGVEALGRGESFNPQIDPIVRVEAIRLRAALARYYAGAGIDDPVVIEMPRGHYVPHFRHRSRRDGPAGLVMAWRQVLQALRAVERFLGLRVTIQVRPGAGKLAAPRVRLLPTAPIAQQAPASDGRQKQQAEGAAATRARRSRAG